jgi:hypothetical protein
MPTVAELDRLQALLNQLIPLTKIQQGDLIKAQDWNTVVGALIEVTRASLSDDASASIPPHEHPDQVAPGWLTPALRSVVERGSLADPAAVAQIDQIKSRLDYLAARIEGGSQDVTDLRGKINDAVGKHLALVNDFNNANRAIQGAADAREDVLSLRETLGGIQKNLQAVQAATLTIDGQPANLQAVADRLKSVESFRDNLKTPSGEVWSGAALEHRLTEVATTFVSQDQLNDALKNRPGKITDKDKGALRDLLFNELTVSNAQLNEQAAAGIRAEMTQRLAGVDAQITQKVADQIPGARDAALAVIRPEILAAVTASADAGKNLLESRLTEANASITNTLASQIEDVQRGIAPALQAELDQRVPAALAEIRGQVDAVNGRATAFEGRLTAQDQALTGLGSRIDTVSQADAAGRDEIRVQLQRTLDAKIKDLSDSVDIRFKGHLTDTNNRLDTVITATRAELLSQIADSASGIASSQISDMATTLRAEMHQAAKDEVEASQLQIPAIVTAQLQQSLADLPQLVDTHLRTALGDVQTMIDTRMAEASNQIQVDVKSRVDAALGGLSPQISQAVKASVDAQLPTMVDTAVKAAAPKLVTTEVKTQLTNTTTIDQLRVRLQR